MTRAFIYGTATAMLLFATTVGASAQSAAALPTSTSATQPVAGGAAGHTPYLTYVWENALARLGFSSSDDSANAPLTRTVSTDAR